MSSDLGAISYQSRLAAFLPPGLLPERAVDQSPAGTVPGKGAWRNYQSTECNTCIVYEWRLQVKHQYLENSAKS
jgi:hypothetical protein